MHFDKRLFICLFFAFIAATVIGTLTHEIGHYVAAKLLGHDAHLHYASTSWRLTENNQDRNLLDRFLILISGPVQTMLTGTIGLVILCIFRQSFYSVNRLSIIQWIVIFVTLCWSRQVANFAIWIENLLLNSNYRSNNDEIIIARHLQIPEGIILTTSALIGSIILNLIIFKFIPDRQRLSFLMAGLFGSLVGYILWIELIGRHAIP